MCKKYTYHCMGCCKEYKTEKLHKYGWLCMKCRQSMKLHIKCSDCNLVNVEVSWKVYEAKYPNGPWRCHDCYIKHQSENTIKQWQELSDEKYKDRCDNLLQAATNQWVGLTHEEKLRIFFTILPIAILITAIIVSLLKQ